MIAPAKTTVTATWIAALLATIGIVATIASFTTTSASAFTAESPADVVGTMYKTWSTTGFTKDNLPALITDDYKLSFACSPFVASCPALYKEYSGVDGFLEWQAATNAVFDFKSFQMVGIAPLAGTNKVLVEASFIPTLVGGKTTGERLFQVHEWTVVGTKVSSFSAYVKTADAGVQENLLEPSPASVVDAAFAQWAKGFTAENAAPLFSDDYVLDFTPPPGSAPPKSKFYGKYTGIAGLLEWQTYCSEFDFSSFKMEGRSAISPTEVLVEISYIPTLKSGKTTGKRVSDVQKWTVVGGKATAFKVWPGDYAAANDLF